MRTPAETAGIAKILILTHTAITLIHGLSHAKLHVELPLWNNIFVFVVIVTGPLYGLFLLRSRKQRTAAITLFATMAGSLVFGLWKHFVVAGPDHVAHLPNGSWQLPFQITAWLLLATEALGTVVAFRLLVRRMQSA